MFQAAVIRLTLWYLALIVALSICFSLVLYNTSSQQLQAEEHRQTQMMHTLTYARDPQVRSFSQNRLVALQNDQVETTSNLIYFNLIILVLGGGLSYLLAIRTLQPLEESMEAQRRFTTDASHELRTPLTAMKTELEVALRDHSLSLEQSKALHRSTLEEIETLESLSNGLLRLARQDRNERARDFQVHPVADIIEEAVKNVAAGAKKKGIDLTTEVGQETVEGESWSLVEVLVILLDNAIKYSPRTTQIRISASTRPHRNIVDIQVSDQGPGISDTDLPHIFERFYRADPSRSKENVTGYGIGLSIAKEITALHRGTLEASKNADGVGTTFTLSLPIHHRSIHLPHLS